ncbi:planarian mariner-8 gene [Nephila pilipes]|uniref:Planarian mariner-8 protein n=1 Tax=Nephila pilipes TaxID=299642 RepID=A0A8X6N6F8_NEPPI|nr:planarian mariner-8 gene [Nephila pilipes]
MSSSTTRQAVANINSVFIIQVATNVTVARWFEKFRSGDFDLSNESHGRPKTQVDSDVLKATVAANSSESAREISLMYNVSKQTILTNLAQIAKWMTPILLQDDARLHAARMTVSKLQDQFTISKRMARVEKQINMATYTL